MVIYRLSIVKRNFPLGNPESMIIDFIEDFEFRKIERLYKKRLELLKRGYTENDLDYTTWETDSTRSYYDIISNHFDFE